MDGSKRLYVFVNQCMSGIGGGQRYVLAKSGWLAERGWNVVICHVENGEVLLNCESVSLADIPELRSAPRILGRRRVDSIVQRVLSFCSNADSVYVESAAPYLGLWGEEIAKAAGGKHLCYVLEESPKTEDINFLRFKRGRHELAFIKNSIAMRAFEDSQGKQQEYDDCVLDAHNPSPIEDLPFENEIVKADYVIGCVSRLDKPAVRLMLEGITSFCEEHLAMSLTVVLVGDTPYESVRKEVAEYGEKLSNLNVQILGYLSPIPRQLVEKFDLFIGKAGAATACAGEGIPTIRYTLDTDKVAGFDRIVEIGGEPVLQQAKAGDKDLPSLLEFALCEGGLARIRESSSIKRIVTTLDYSDHMAFIPASNSRTYYDSWNSKVSIGRRLASYWVKLFGNTKYEDLVIALRRRFDQQS